jgi:ubiquitin-protein ligase E3 A
VAQTLQNLATINGYRHPEPVSHTLFYAPSLIDAEEEEIKDMFIAMLEKRFSLLKYPALLDAAAKSSVLQLQAVVDTNGAARQAMVASLFSRTSMRDFFLCLNIKRHEIVPSTLLELQRNLSKIRSPLRVTFVGEDGIDEGGVRKEFFQLLCKELLSLDYGMFQETPSSHALWPVADAKNNENRREFWLIGMVIGLAVFNNVILDVRFPTALFKKLLRIEPSLVDLEDLDPELGRGLQALLDFKEGPDGTVEDVFARTFTYEYELYGAKQQDELCPDGANVPLTGENRQEYVRLLTRHLLTQSIYSNFEEFRKGFDQVCDRDMIRKMHPQELELLICGNPELDFRALEESTNYDGFDPKDTTIQFFWEVVHELDDNSKRNFLRFCTGSDRVPIRGLADLHFVVGKNGGDGDLLPTAHTCFNHLLLPMYKDKETLKTKLLLAIHNCQGFGLK